LKGIPPIKISEVKPGDDILIGHHLLIAPALMLDKKLTIDEGSFLDFCSMINMTTLHKRLIVLPGHLDESIIQSSLYQYLIEEGILYEVIFPYLENYDEDDKKEVSDLVGRVIHEYDVDQVMGGTLYYDELLRQDQEYSILNPELENNTSEMREKFVNQVIESAISFRGQQVYRDNERNLTKAQKITRYVHRLRTAQYWIVAAKRGLTFAPDFIRIPILADYVAERKARLDWYIRDLIQKTVDNIARKELESTSRMKSAELMPIPNAAANFLNRYSSTGDMEKSFRDTREEYEKYKSQIIEWEKRQFDPEINQAEKFKLKKEIAETLRDSLADNERTVAIIESAFGVILNPGFSSAVPVAKEIRNLVKKYRAKKRICYFLNGKKEAALINQHPLILERVFGKSFNKGQLERFKDLVNALDTFSLGAEEKNIFSK
jgi:hypothetical protein